MNSTHTQPNPEPDPEYWRWAAPKGGNLCPVSVVSMTLTLSVSLHRCIVREEERRGAWGCGTHTFKPPSLGLADFSDTFAACGLPYRCALFKSQWKP